MYTLTSLVLLAAASTTLASPIQARQNPCFIIGSTALPAEVSASVASISSVITCTPNTNVLQGVPDVVSGGVSFSSVNFAASSSNQSPLAFALSKFATKSPLASNDLAKFQNELNVYLAVEAGIRSVGGNFAAIKIPKFFLEFQISRIETAQGNPPAAAGLQVDHLLGKVTKNAAGEKDKSLLDEVTRLSKVLA
ncbi:hypothetical protein GE09DRAFT_1049772 [Coniochaeta sp. 2T2.1]|nr:hypothetical protein GE09DRAFT_1049772 [Coniochaeta sp. 2T2.1]